MIQAFFIPTLQENPSPLLQRIFLKLHGAALACLTMYKCY